MVNTELPTVMYTLADRVERIVMKMIDKQAHEMLENSGFNWRQLAAAAMARTLAYGGHKAMCEMITVVFSHQTPLANSLVRKGIGDKAHRSALQKEKMKIGENILAKHNAKVAASLYRMAKTHTNMVQIFQDKAVESI